MNVSNGIVMASPVDFEKEGSALFTMTGGEINMDSSYLGSSKINNGSETDRIAGESRLSESRQ